MIEKNGGVTDDVKEEMNKLLFNNPNIEIIRITDEDLEKDAEKDDE